MTKMAKKIISVILSCILISVFSLPVFAATESDTVVDLAEILNENQEAELNSMIKEIKDTYNFDITIIAYYDTEVTAEMAGDYAENYVNIDLEADGLVLANNLEMREYFTSVRGDYRFDAFTSSAHDYIEEELLYYLRDDRYYEAYVAHIEATEQVLKTYFAGETFSTPIDYSTKIMGGIVVGLIAGLIVAAIYVAMLKKQMNTAVAQRAAANYVKKGSFNLSRSSDRYLYSTTSKTARAKSSSGGGGSTSSRGGSRSSRGGSY